MTMPAIARIYETARAPNPRRVSLFLAEKGVEVERVEVDIMNGEQFQSEHRARAGSHHVPVMELEDGTCISETIAICQYIEALHPEPNLMGAGAKEAAIISMWQRRVEFGLLMNTGFAARHSIPAMAALEQNQVPDWGESCLGRMELSMRELDQRLQQNPFIAGDRFTIADITAWASLDFMRVLRRKIPEDCEALARFYESLRTRPSASA